jgi:hypothetical protein
MIASALASGCDRGSPDFESDQGPAPQVVWSSPQDGATAVALRQSVRVQFDRFLRPETASRQSICIQAGPSAPCEGAAIEYDPVDRVVVAKLNGALLPTQRYTVRLVAPTASAPDQGVRAFDDAALAKDVTFAFTTGDASAMPTLPEPMRAADFCGAMPSPGGTFKSPCGLAGCHGPAGQGAPMGGALRLVPDSGSRVDAIRALLGASGSGQPTVAIETATAADPTAARRGGTGPFGQNMPYLDPTNPGNSYVVYKMMFNQLSITPSPCLFDPREPTIEEGATCDPGTSSVQPWVPNGSGKPPVLGEYDRLKGRIRGNGMSGDVAALRSVSAWIAAGATTPMADCP